MTSTLLIHGYPGTVFCVVFCADQVGLPWRSRQHLVESSSSHDSPRHWTCSSTSEVCLHVPAAHLQRLG